MVSCCSKFCSKYELYFFPQVKSHILKKEFNYYFVPMKTVKTHETHFRKKTNSLYNKFTYSNYFNKIYEFLLYTSKRSLHWSIYVCTTVIMLKYMRLSCSNIKLNKCIVKPKFQYFCVRQVIHQNICYELMKSW